MAPHAGTATLDLPTRARRTRRTQEPARRARAGGVILEALPSALMPAAAPEPHTVAAPREPTEEQVRLRAYELYVARGRVDGHAMEDWMQAERELRARAMD